MPIFLLPILALGDAAGAAVEQVDLIEVFPVTQLHDLGSEMLHGSVGAAVLASGAGVGGPVHVGRQRYFFNVQAVNDDNTIGNIRCWDFLSLYPYYNFKNAFWPVFRKLFCRTKKERSALQTVHKTHRFLIPNDTYVRVQTVPHLWRCKKQSAGAVNEQMPREIALTRHLQHFAYKAVRDA